VLWKTGAEGVVYLGDSGRAGVVTFARTLTRRPQVDLQAVGRSSTMNKMSPSSSDTDPGSSLGVRGLSPNR